MYGTKSGTESAVPSGRESIDGELVEAELDASEAEEDGVGRDTDLGHEGMQAAAEPSASDTQPNASVISAPTSQAGASPSAPGGALHPPLKSRTPGAYSMTATADRMRAVSSAQVAAAQAQAAQVAGPSQPPAASPQPESIPPERPERSSEAAPPSVSANPLEREIRARADRLKKEDNVSAARAYVELGLLCEWILYDRIRAKKHYEVARDCVRTLQPALTRIRRIGAVTPPGPGAVAPSAASILKETLEVLHDEVAVAETDELRADLLATRARTLEAASKLEDARATFVEALRYQARHPATMHALEALLRREINEENRTNLAADLAEHLARQVEATQPDGTEGDALLSAWMCVERAEILERQLKQVPAARDALKRAVAFAPNPGPVRSALVRHLSRHDRDTGLAEALRVEAERENDPDRAARLLYASARIQLDRLNSRGEGVAALTRAEMKAPHGSLTQAKVLGELVTQLDLDGDHAKLVEIRVKRLGLLSGREAIAFEYLRLADSYGRLGRADLSADAAARALLQDPTSRAIRETLDQSFQRLGRHPDRVRAWLLEANSERPLRDRVRAFLRAADVCARHLGQPDQAIDALRAAWHLDPGNGGVFDALSALLRPAHRSSVDANHVANAEQRIDLYDQASVAESDKERKLGLLEKALAIWEDELERTDKVIEIAERMLQLDPNRRSAILALQRATRRSGDHEKLARALDAEARQTPDPKLKCRILLEAAEIAERRGDRERALGIIDRALSTKPNDIDASRARVALLRRMSRLDEARKTLVTLAEHDPETTFETWIDVADLDESFRKAPLDAVEAYRAAHKVNPEHPLPQLSLLRLLRSTKSFKQLIRELEAFATEQQTDVRSLCLLRTTSAEVEELAIGNDEAALVQLDAADAALTSVTDAGWDPGLFEAMERILFRLGDDDGLMRLYARWLERKPSASIDHNLRIGLATALESASPTQSIEVLEALVSVVPTHIPALRRLEHLHRARKAFQPLAATLLAQASVFQSRRARIGALWEIVGMEEKLGAHATLDALNRLTRENPADLGALDAIIRVASRLVCNVGVPHPALLAARNQLLGAVRARRDLTVDPLARATYFIEEAALLEGAEVDQNIRGALEAYKEALTLWPDSFLAARGLERLAIHMGDHQSVITSQLALAKLSETNVAKAAHLVKAAELTASHLRDERTALELYEVALETDPENQNASRTLAAMLVKDPRRLIERLRPALDRAQSQPQASLLGAEIAQAYLRIHHAEGDAARIDYGPGIAAMRRAMRPNPDDVNSLFVLARLYSAQKAWGESRDTLQRIVELSGTSDLPSRQTALFGLADLFEGPLADAALAETMLVNILSGEAGNKTALERLYAIGVKNGDKKLARSTLERLAEYETDLAQRTEYQLRVAEVAREANDGSGMLRALSDAVVSTPQDMRPWTLLARLCRGDTHEGAQSLAHAIEQIVEMAKGRRRPLEPRWLLTLGLLEINMLKRINEGVAHLQAALGAASVPGAPPPHPEIRAALGTGLLAAGRTKDAIMILRELCTTDSDTLLRLIEPSAFNTVRSACVAPQGPVLGAVLACLDSALASEGRTDERLPVEEIRGLMGDLPGDRLAKIRQRRMEPEAPFANALAASELTRMLMPEARSPLIDVAIAIQPIVAKVLRFELSTYGVSTRERIGPRDGNPVRGLADRIARCLGVSEFELIISANWTQPIRVFPGDPPIIVAPMSFVELGETEQAFGLARLLTRIALGMTFLDEVSAEVADAILMSAIRSILPQWGLGELNPGREHALSNIHAAMQRAIGRRQRKVIEDLAPTLSASVDTRTFFVAVRRSEYRSAYVLSGDAYAAIETMRRADPELARSGDNIRALLQYPVSCEMIRYALSADAYGERRRVGVIWGPASGGPPGARVTGV